MTILQFILVLAVIFIAHFVRGTFGFADALIAMPLLAMLLGLQTAAPLVALLSLVNALSILIHSRKHLKFSSAWRLILSTLVGIPIGLYMLKGVQENVMRLILAAVLIGFPIFQLYRPKKFGLKNERWAPLFGGIAGILGGAYNTNGPAIVIYAALRHWPPKVFRATLQAYFFSTGLLIVAGHGLGGLWTKEVFTWFALALPVLGLGVFLGTKLHHRLPEGKFDHYVHGLLLIIGVYLLVQTIV
ncbi:sulfite exporter TauE/SafE family protein [bacterium]|nr:sulfite exporter TauE/SafE family protein [bacterium]